MTAQPETVSDIEEWPGGWVNFYQYRGGQQHFGTVICATREAADKVRADWFAQRDEQAVRGLVLAFHLTHREPFFIAKAYDIYPIDSPSVAKARNCTFSIAVPCVKPDVPQDDDIPF